MSRAYLGKKEWVVIGVDCDGHVGEANIGDEKVMGRYGLRRKNAEGQMIDFSKQMEMAV